MTLNKKHCLIFLTIFLALILGTTMVSATDDTNNTQGITDNKEISTPQKYDVDKMVQSKANKISKDADEQTTDTTNNKDKEITKKTDTTTKKEAQQETATNYDTLKSILTSSTDEELTVTLDEGTYAGNGQITVNSAIKTLTIDGNGQTVNGNSKAFLKVENLDLTLKNIIITGCNNYDGSVLYQNGGQTTIINSTIKQNTLSSSSNTLGVIKVASGSLTLDNNTFDSNSVTTATTSRHGFIIHTTQTSKIINNIFINNDCNDEPNGYAGLINRLVDEIHDNEYYDNYLSNYIDVSFLDHNDQVVIGENADFERDIQVKLSKNVYNDTVRNGTLTIGMGAGQFGSHYKTFDVVNGTAHVVITRAELTEYHNPSESDGRDTVYLDYDALDRSYHTNVGATMLIISEDIDPRDDVQVLITEYNKTLFVGEINTIKGNIGIKTGGGYWTDDGEHYLYYTEPFSDVLITLVIDDKTTTTTTRSDSDGNFELNYDTFNHTAGQVFFNIGIKKEGMFDIKEYFDDSDEESFTLKAYTNITLSAPDVTIGETVTITGQVYIPVNGKKASVSSTVKNKLLNITINGGTPISIKITGGKISYQYTPTEMGEFTVTVSWGGTSSYLASSNTTKFRVSPAQTNMTIVNNETILVGQNVEIKGVLRVDSGAVVKNTNVTITVGTKTYENIAVNASGQYYLSCPIDEVGPHVITVTYINHTTGYFSSTNTSSVLVNPRKTNMTIENNESIIVGQEVTINGTLSDEFGEVIKNTYVNITVGTTPVNNVIVNENGFYETTCIIDEVGIINITVNYTNDNVNYTSSINTSNVTVIPRITNMTINNNESIFVGLQVNITGTLYDELGDIVPNTFVNITVGENIIKNVPVDENGNFSTLYQIDEIGEYPITVIYTNDTTRYYSSTNSSKVTVNPRNTYTVIDDTESVFIGQNVTIKGILYDELDEIVPNTIVTIRIDENYINENVIVDDEGKFELSYNATSVGEHNITVIYTNDTTRYINSTNKSVFTVNPRTTNMTIEFDSPKVGEVLTVSGYLTDNLGEKVTNTIVNVTVGTAKNSNVIVDGNGYYETQFTLTQNGTYDIIVEYINHSTNYVSSTNTTVYELYKIPTITNVTVIDNTVYRVTIDVVVKADDTSNESIESGYLNITVNGESKLYPVTGQTTRIILDSNVNITTTDEVDFKVEYVENDKYLNSTGINSTNDEVITKFTARALNTNLTINVSPDPQNITDDINITGQVIDELGNIIQNGKVIISINGTSPETVPFVDGEYKYTYHTNVAGIIPFNVTYVGEKTNNGNILINESINSSTFTVNKIPTVTNVTLLNASYSNVTISVNVTDARNSSKFVTTGVIQVYDFINGKLLIQEYPVANGNVELKLPINTTGIVKLLIVYPENNIYLESNARNESAFSFDKDVYVINVEKLPSIASVEKILNNKSGEVALRVNVTNTTGDLISSGHVIVINSTNGELLGEGDIADGKVDILLESLTEPGIAEVNVTYMGNDFYLPSNATGLGKSSGDNITEIIVTVDPEITISLSEDNVVINKPVTISGEVFNYTHGKTQDGGKVVLSINGTNVNAEFDAETGNYMGNYIPLASGVYTINASYYDKNNQLVVTSENVLLTVDKINSTTSVTIVNSTAGNVTLDISVAGVDGNKSMTGIVNITVDGNIIVPVELTGEETITVNLRDNITRSGPVSIVVEFIGNDNYYSSTDSSSVIDVVNQTAILQVVVSEENVVNSSIVIITGNLTDDLGNKLSDSYVEIMVDNEVVGIVKTDNEGVFTLNYVTDKLGENIVNATYYGDNIRYSNATDNTKFIVYKLNTTIELNVSDINYTQDELVNITINETSATGLVTVVVTSDVEGFNTITEVVNFNGEVIQLPLAQLSAGEYTVTVSYDGDSKYDGNISTKTFKVLAANDYILPVTAENITYGENETITVTVPDDATGFVTISIDGTSISEQVPINGSQATLVIDAYTLPADEYTVNVEFSDSNYATKTNTTIFKVTKSATTLTVNVTSPVKAGQSTLITGTLVDATGKPVSGEKVEVKVDNKPVASPVTNAYGKYTITFNDTIVGTHNVGASYNGNNNYMNSTAATTLTVEKLNTKITIDTIKDVPVTENVVISAKVVDEKAVPVASAQVKVSFDGKTQNVTSDNNGNIRVTIPTSTVGNKEVIVIYDGNSKYNPSNMESTARVVKNNATITLSMPSNVKVDQTATVKGKVTDKNGKTLPNIPVNVTVNGKTIPTVTDSNGNFQVEANNVREGTNNVTATASNANYNINSASGKFTATRKEAKLTVDPIKDSKLKDNITITGKLVDEQNKPISYAPVQVTVNGKTSTVTTDKNGNYQLPATGIVEGTNNVSVKYEDPEYKTQTVKASFKASTSKTVVKVPSITGVIGEDITLTAYVTDDDGKPVSGGNLVFKLNGKTLRTDGRFDTNSSPLKLHVEDGVVKYTIKADLYLRNGKNITASYSGSSKYDAAKANVATANIKKRDAQVKVTITPNKAVQNTDIVFTATLSDVTPRATNKTSLTTDANIIFKVNGVTIKDKNGKADRIRVTHSVINYAYHVPTGMGGVDDSGVKNYTVEAVYDNPVFYPDTRNSSVFHVQRSIINVNFIKTGIKNNVLSVKARFTDYENKNVVGNNKVCVKINGITYKENGEVKYFTVKDGNVDLTGIKIAKGTNVKEVMLVTGAREGYMGARATTTEITS